MEILSLNKIDEALNNLETSFKTFQQKQDHRFNQAYSAKNRPFLTENQNDSDCVEKKAFLNYVGKGFEGYDQKSLTAQEGSQGGYLIPQPMMEHIHQTLLQSSPLRSLARVTSISGDSLELLLDKGCADVGWVSEVEDRAETTTPELIKLKIPTHQIYAKPRAIQKLLDDAIIDLETWLISKITDKIARTETAAFIHGDGNGKPRGFLNYPLVEAGCSESGKIEAFKSGADGDLPNSDTLLDVLNAMKPEYLPGAVWLMSRSAMASIRRLKDRSTGNYLWQPGLLAGQPHNVTGTFCSYCG